MTDQAMNSVRPSENNSNMKLNEVFDPVSTLLFFPERKMWPYGRGI
jgi:hypothetical protein